MMLLRNIKLFSLLTLSTLTSPLLAQCDNEDFLDDCADLLGDYRFVKSYNSEFSKSGKDGGEMEFSYVFSKGTNYVITICNNGDENPMVLELYDRNRKKISSSYNSKTKKHYSKVGYACTATGVYYLKTKSTSSKGSCGVCIIGFKKPS